MQRFASMASPFEQLFELGTEVEITSNTKGYRNSWYKATVIPPPKLNNNLLKTKWKNDFLWVEYDTILDEEDASKKYQEYTDISLIRPLPPTPKNSEFDKFDFVDAYHKDGWFTGVVLDVMDVGLKYLVAFLHPYEEFVYERDAIRVHLEWLGGSKWTKWHPSEKVIIAFCAPNVGEDVVGSPLESTVSTAERAPSPSKNLKQTISGDCGSNAPVSYPEPATTECPNTRPITSDKSQGWPFTKKSSLWEVIESMEVFKRAPEMPHFSPLNELEENSREITAICMMAQFSYVAERISAGSPDCLNSLTSIQDTLKSLNKLQSHGFNTTPLQVYVKKKLVLMEKEKDLEGNLEEVQCMIKKCQDEKTAHDRKVNELANQITSLEEQIQSNKSVICLKDLQLANLESRRTIISRKLHSLELSMKPSFNW